MTDETATYTLTELSMLADVPQRTIRYYIQQGLVDRPEGAKRGAHYTPRHLGQLLEIRKWQRAGLSLDRIAELLGEPDDATLPPLPRRRPGDVRVRSHIHLAPGIELAVDPTEADLSPEDIRALAREAAALIRKFDKRSN